MSENISPEERLFKVIQQGKLTKGQEKCGSEKKAGGWPEKIGRFITAQAVRDTGTSGKESFLARIRWPELDLAGINKVLVVVLTIVLMFAVYSALGKRKDVAFVETAARSMTSPEEGKNKIEPLKDLSFYLNVVRKRDLFRTNAGTSSVGSVQKASELLTKAAERLKLQGISWGAVPKAMILVQNDKEGDMYFLVEGQVIGTTGLKVLEISRSSVKISDGKEETVLL